MFSKYQLEILELIENNLLLDQKEDNLLNPSIPPKKRILNVPSDISKTRDKMWRK